MNRFRQLTILSLTLLFSILSSFPALSEDTQDIIFNATDKEMKRAMKKLTIKIFL